MSRSSHASCPTAVVAAPVDVVWALLTEPGRWGDFFDIRITAVSPVGSASVGQVVRGTSGPKILGLALRFTYADIDLARHRLVIDVELPLGVVVQEDLNCIPIDGDRCRVNYGCHFAFPGGWRGFAARWLLRREIETGPADSLARLKHRAETIHANARAAV